MLSDVVPWNAIAQSTNRGDGGNRYVAVREGYYAKGNGDRTHMSPIPTMFLYTPILTIAMFSNLPALPPIAANHRGSGPQAPKSTGCGRTGRMFANPFAISRWVVVTVGHPHRK